MKNIYVILFLCIILQVCAAKSKKKSLKTTTAAPEEANIGSAILAIEIVDPNENSTTRNSKRTIESALGYGYNSYDTSKPRYEIYKYSQHDIPPYKGKPSNSFKGPGQSIQVQNPNQYSPPPKTEYTALKPGTTLYSSLSDKGQISDLTSSVSHISGLGQNQIPVPVVVLRIYPDQLKDSTIQANLPPSHPFAKVINSVNLQSLLLHYIKALQNQNSGKLYSASQSNYEAPTPAPDYYKPSKPNYYTQATHEKSVPGYQQSNSAQMYQYYPEQSGVEVQAAPLKYEFKYTSPSTQKPYLKKPEATKPQYYYIQPTAPSDRTQYYQPPQQLEYTKQAVPQYFTPNDQAYYQPKGYRLLTAENYPSDKHTRVVFRTKTGNVRTPEQEEAPEREIKTIKIRVPDNIAKVEVQETEKPLYPYSPEYSQANPEAPADAESYSQDQDGYSNYEGQQDYYPAGGNPEDQEAGNFNYQNIDYNQMAKYLNTRGAMPSYFFQNTQEAEKESQPSEDVLAAYDDAAFPSTTQAPEKKKAKRKRQF